MKRATLKRIFIYMGRYKKYLYAAFACSILSNLLVIFGPRLIGEGIDRMIGQNNVDFSYLAKLVVLLSILYILGSIFQWFMSAFSNTAANNTMRDIRKKAFDHLNSLPLSYYDQTPHGDVISRLTNDIDAMSEGLFQGITQAMSAMIIILGSFVFMLSISPSITLIVLLITPLCFVIASFIAKQSRKMYTKQSVTTGELNGYVEEYIGNQGIVSAFGYEDRSYERYHKINKELYHWGQQAQWYSSLTNPTTRLINNMAYVAVSVVGGLLAIRGGISIGNIASFITYSNQFAKPINEITSLSSQIQSALASAERVFELIDQQSEVESSKRVREYIEKDGEVEFQQVYFSYVPDTPLIQNLNLTVKPRQMVAIVGPTGSGKTTLVNLLMRFYNVNSGNILIDGESIYQVTKESLRRTIGMVLQESWLFTGSVAENIAYGKPTATRQEIINAAKEAYAHGFIMRLSQGYDTIIDEDGGNLSQGQKQLLTIARVMLTDPAMLILDEATSSIDTRTEVLIQKAFAKIMKGRTSFVIAHRLSTITGADIILVLKDGDIIEKGHHDELLSQKGFYYTMVHSQLPVE